MLDARIGDDDVQAAVARHHCGQRCALRRFVGHVERRAFAPAARRGDLSRGLAKRIGVAGIEDDHCAGGGVGIGNRAPQTARCTGHQGDLAGQRKGIGHGCRSSEMRGFRVLPPNRQAAGFSRICRLLAGSVASAVACQRERLRPDWTARRPLQPTRHLQPMHGDCVASQRASALQCPGQARCVPQWPARRLLVVMPGACLRGGSIRRRARCRYWCRCRRRHWA